MHVGGSGSIQAVTLNIPAPSQLPSAPFVIVADEAFPLKTSLLLPYPEKGLPEPDTLLRMFFAFSASAGECANAGCRSLLTQPTVSSKPPAS